MSDLDKVREYLKDNEKSYVEFLGTIKSVCREIGSELGGLVVLRVYDRTDKQGGEPLKEAGKVREACPGPINISNLKKVADIIGVTIVVQYPDQVCQVLDRLKEALSTRSAAELRRKPHHTTYFATHATYRSTAVAHGGILCEVQCKTVLHDAWSAKMHDLTYKPLGSMDPRMKGLIEAISTSLEGLEQQSQIARDMILSRQSGERKPFQAALKAYLSSVEDWLQMTTESRDCNHGKLTALRDDVKEYAESGSGDGASDKASELGERILSALETDTDAGRAWLIAMRFASALPAPEGIRFLGNAADGLVDSVSQLRKQELISEAEMRAIPIGFYALQEFGRALEYVDKLLSQAARLTLSKDGISILKYNKAAWMLERESLRQSKPTISAAIRKEIETLLDEVRPSLTLKDGPSVKDTDGLMLIVYGGTKEDVRRGIDMCMEAGEPIEGNELETAVALAYAEWRNLVGWRRYFDMAESEVERVGA